MTTTAQSIIRRCAEALTDTDSVYWTVGELARHLNDGQREIVVHRPDATQVTEPVALVAGAHQSIPAGGVKLIDVPGNSGGRKRGVSLVDKRLLDAAAPGWQSMAGVTEIQHYMFDPRDPTAFDVYPPAASSGASLDVVYSASPVDITEPADGATPTPGSKPYTLVTGNISVPDIYSGALRDYVLYRALARDSENGGYAQRAQAYYTLFANALGIEIKSTAAFAPQSSGKNNAARAGQ